MGGSLYLTREGELTSKTKASLFLGRVVIHLKEPHYKHRSDTGRDYHDRKAAQLCEFLSELLLAETCIESWMEDLGSNGCQVEDSSIGGVPCIMADEDINKRFRP